MGHRDVEVTGRCAGRGCGNAELSTEHAERACGMRNSEKVRKWNVEGGIVVEWIGCDNSEV